jgi:hypothetical protein
MEKFSKNQSSSGKKKPTKPNQPKKPSNFEGKGKPPEKPTKCKEFKLPKCMKPTLQPTAQSRLSFHEEGGCSLLSKSLRGYAKLICDKTGNPNHPIYVFNKRVFDKPSQHKHSMAFYIYPEDYIVSEMHQSPTDQYPNGKIIVNIVQLIRNSSDNKTPEEGKKGANPAKLTEGKKSDGNSKKKKKQSIKPALFKADATNCTLRTVTTIVIRLTKKSTKEGYDDFYNKPIDPNHRFIQSVLQRELVKHNILHLKPVILRAIAKANTTETSYSYYKPSALADKFSRISLPAFSESKTASGLKVS